MMFIVIKDFCDLQDDNHIYKAGETYPRKGKATKKRVEELTTSNNSANEPFIKEVGDK